MIRYWLTIVTLVLAPVFDSQAYERDTHRELSKKAAVFSVLQTDPDLMNRLGLGATGKFPNSESKQRTISELIEDGADFEDNLFLGTVLRVRHHFYDPLYNRPLTVLGIAAGEKSPDWALEDLEDFGSQAFSFRHARDYLYKALTLSDEQERKKHFGPTFQTLGHVIHHVQDMAQPQHVRNDIHPNVGAHKSFYEEYTDHPRVRSNLMFSGYNAVTFPQARSFWTTGEGKGLSEYTNRGFISAGTNFGDPSNRYPNPAFDPNSAWEADIRRPDLFPAANMPIPPECQSDASPCYMTFYRNTVVDSYRPSETKVNDKASTWSIFDQDLKAYNKTYTKTDPDTGQTYTTNQAFSLNRFNFDATHKFLIPRAVAYSSGLIDYFFRGQIDLDIEYDETTEGQYLIKNKGTEVMKGDFTLYYDADDGKRYPVAGDTGSVTWRNVTIEPNKNSAPLKAPRASSDPKPKKPEEYFLVFKGEMGEEKPPENQAVGAVVAKTKRKLLWEPWGTQLTDNHPWRAEAGTVNRKLGPNSQTIENGRLVVYAGSGGAGGVIWQATTPADVILARYMKVRFNCSQSASMTNWEVYGYLSIGSSLYSSQTIPFAGGAGPSSSPYDLIPRPTTSLEYIVDVARFGAVGYLGINTIGFEADLRCSVDYVDFSKDPFEKVADGAVYIP